MDLQQASADAFDKRIRDYKEKTLVQLRLIIPKWAYGKDVRKMLNKELNPKKGKYLIFLVNPKELLKVSEFLEVNKEVLFTGNRLNDGRVATILHRWDNNQFIDPPTIDAFNSKTSKLGFSDGRHRSKTSYLLGHMQMPIAINKQEIDNISKVLKLIPV